MVSSYGLVRAGEKSYYIDSPSRIGIYRRDSKEVYLIDSGNDTFAAQCALDIIKENSWQLAGIVNTHSHADHIAGNAFLRRETGCEIFAPEEEIPFIKNPTLEAMALIGSQPPEELKGKLLLAEASSPKSLKDKNFPDELEIVPLPGHCCEMAGIKTPDGTFFAADSVSNPEGLRKYRVTYIYDVKLYLETLDNLKAVDAALFVPSHAPETRDIAPLADFNKKWVKSNISDIMLLTRGGAAEGDIVKGFFDKYSLKISYEQFFIVRSTLLSYLTYLKNEGRIRTEFLDNRLVYFAN